MYPAMLDLVRDAASFPACFDVCILRSLQKVKDYNYLPRGMARNVYLWPGVGA